jgi:hypothetical protein
MGPQAMGQNKTSEPDLTGSGALLNPSRFATQACSGAALNETQLPKARKQLIIGY